MRLVTFNILHGRSLADGRVDVGRFADAVRSLDADVLALQEVDRGQARSGGADLTAVAAEAMGARHHRFAAALTGTPGGAWVAATDDEPGQAAYGVALLSRCPVQSWRVIRLPPLRVPALWVFHGSRRPVLVRDEPRVAVVAGVTLPGGRLTVAATHLSFLHGWNVVQLRLLRRALATTADPLVLMGDLNMSRRTAQLASGLSSTVLADTFPAPEPTRQIDHILARGLRGPFRGGAVLASVSDHRALVLDLTAAGTTTTGTDGAPGYRAAPVTGRRPGPARSHGGAGRRARSGPPAEPPAT
jgi:endonuclease/exonuclease/phosphatase family metal-dependent hydrolase